MQSEELINNVARRIYEDRHAGMNNIWNWDDNGLDDEHPGVRAQYEGYAKSAIAALSAAEPVGWQWRNPRWTVGDQWQHCPDGPREDKLPGTEYRPVYAAPTAPSVAVKALADAYKAGFDASSQGYNGETFPEYEADSEWLAQRDSDLSALSAQVQDVAGWERVTIETGRKSGTSHTDVWPDGEGWEIDTDRGRVNTPDAGWDRFSNHEELYFRRRANELPAAHEKQEG